MSNLFLKYTIHPFVMGLLGLLCFSFPAFLELKYDFNSIFAKTFSNNCIFCFFTAKRGLWNVNNQ